MGVRAQDFPIGVRAQDFGEGAARALAARIRAAGIQSGFSAAGVGIAVLGCYINPVDDDEARRDAGLDRFRVHLKMARLLGDPLVGTETGWSDRGYTRSPDAMKTLLNSLVRMIGAAEDFGARIAIEGVCRHVVWRPRIMREVIRSMASKRLAVIYDPVNYLDEGNWRDQDRLIKEAFDSFGDSIAVVHAKDFRPMDDRGAAHPGEGLQVCPAGSGLLDWPLVMRKLGESRRRGANAPLPFLLEDLDPADAPRARQYIESLPTA
jgi:sugar phosphate isomerase/epimerase